ncbi:MAG TPA: 3'(2'),5'-bisphosphate nucleotidase CysQ [Polyangia bacterium]|nr:3'(2'),5'-bisphosphate nucleotidase CysQ [Polyangia bacterium]
MTAFARELDVATRIARDASELVRGYHGKQLTVQIKGGDEPVTEADHAASALIVARLHEAFPDDVVLSEELPDTGERLGKPRVWMVDPIDGTRDFVRGESGFVVMLGLAIDGRPQVGAVGHPLTGYVYAGAPGAGAWREDAAGTRTPLHTSTLSQPPDIRLVASKSHRSSRIDAVKRALQITDEMNVGSIGLKIGLVSEALRDLYVYTGGRTKIWDTCGPEAVLAAAGGRMTDVDGNPLVYDQPDLYNRRGLVASNGPLHDFVIETLRPIVAPAS